MSIPDALQRFIGSHRNELTLSVYMEAPPADPTARRDRHLRLRHALNHVRDGLVDASPDEYEAFERCVNVVLSRLKEGGVPTATESLPGPGGCACFVAAGGEVLVLKLPGTVETSVRWELGASWRPPSGIASREARRSEGDVEQRLHRVE